MKEKLINHNRIFWSIFIIGLEIIPILILLLSPIPKTVSSTMIKVGYVSLICFAMTLMSKTIESKEKDGFFYFIFFLYIFSFGQCFMAIFGSELKDTVFALSIGFFSETSIVYAAVFVLISICLTCTGYYCWNIFYTSPKHKINSSQKVLYDKKTQKTRKTGWTLLIIGLVPTIYRLYNDINTLSTNGYGSTLVHETGIQRIISILSGFFISGLLIVFCFERKYRKAVYIIIIFYWVGELAGGSRLTVFRTAIIFVLIEDLYLKKLNKKRWIMLCFFGVIGVITMSLVSSIRNYVYLSDNIIELVKESLSKLMKDNFIFSAINEMGNTQLINTLVVDNCPKIIPFQYGLSFIKMLIGIFPNVFGFPLEGVDSTFSGLYILTDAGMGASYISEGYWNFGYFSIIYFIGFGAFFAKMCMIFKKMCSSEKEDPTKFFLVVYILYYLMFLVRSELFGVGRQFVYYALIPYIIINFRKDVRKDGNSKKIEKIKLGGFV